MTRDPLPRSFWLLWAGSLINRLGTFVVPFLVLFLTAERSFSYAEAGRTAALFGFGSVLAGPVGGTIADRLGRKVSMGLGLILGAVLLLCIFYARSPLQIGGAVFFCGLGSDLFRPGLFATLSDLITPAQRPRAFGLAYWAHNLGFALAMPLGGMLAGTGYSKLFYADAGTNLLFAGLILFFIPETLPKLAAKTRSTATSADLPRSFEHQGPRDLRATLRDPPFLFFAAMMTLCGMSLLQVLSSLPLSMRAQGIDTSVYGQLVSINGFLIVCLQPFAESLVGGLRPSRRLGFALAIIALGMSLQAFCTRPLDYALAIPVWTLGEIALAGIAPAVVAHLAPVHLRGAYQGVYGMSWSAGALLAPLLGPPLLAAQGPVVLWLATGATALCSSLGMFALGTRLERAATEL